VVGGVGWQKKEEGGKIFTRHLGGNFINCRGNSGGGG